MIPYLGPDELPAARTGATTGGVRRLNLRRAFAVALLSVGISAPAAAAWDYEPSQASAEKLTLAEAIKLVESYLRDCQSMLNPAAGKRFSDINMRRDHIDLKWTEPVRAVRYRFADIQSVLLKYSDDVFSPDFITLYYKTPQGRYWNFRTCVVRSGAPWKGEGAKTLADALLRLKLGYDETIAAAEGKFQTDAASYRAANPKPDFPEDARRFRVQAEAALRDKRFDDAAERYAEGLALAPWWLEGRFNLALVLGELKAYDAAMREMKRYLQLAPEASNARAAQDKIYEWEGAMRK